MKTLFWNVDTQYDFMRSDEDYKGKLAIPGARDIEVNLKLLTQYAKENNLKVVNSADWHHPESEELSDKPNFITTFPEHCMANTFGAEFVPATKPENSYVIDWRDATFKAEEVKRNRNIVLYKDKFDVFTGTRHTNGIVDLLHPEKAVVYGVATNVCVDFAVRGLLERKIEVYVPTDAIKELPNIPLPYDNWKVLGAKLVTTKDVLEGKIW